MSSTHHHQHPHPHHHHRPEQQHSTAMLPHHPPPPPVVPLQQLPSASIVQLPPSFHVPKAVQPPIAVAPSSITTSYHHAPSFHGNDSTTAIHGQIPPVEQFTNPNKRPFSSLTPATATSTAVAYQSVPPISSSSSSSPSASFTEMTPQNQSQSMHYPTGQQSLYNNNSNNVVNDPVANTTTTTGNNNSNLSEKKLRRLEKNRLSARECRRRKREATEDMEQEIFRLEAENLKLRLQLRIGEEAEESICREQDRVTEEIEHLLKSGASEGEIYATIEDFKEKFADYGRDRRSAIEFHLHNVERLLQPTQTTSVAMRALEGGTKLMESGGMMPSTADGSQPTFTASTAIAGMGDATQSESTNEGASLLEPKTLFSYLVNYLQVTPEQAAALKDSRWVARELDECLHSSLDVLEELRQRLRLCGNGLETEFDNVRSVLTPTQAAKFLVWVANNRACIHMLNELWSRVYPDPSADDFEEEDRKPEAKDTIPESSQAPY